MISTRMCEATQRRFAGPRSVVLALVGVLGLSLLASACGSGGSPGSDVARDLAGTWQGRLRGADNQRIVMKISKTENASWKAVLYDADSRTPGRPATFITVHGPTITWSLAAPRFSYEGKASADGNSILGTWTGTDANGDHTSRLDFKRATKATAWPIAVSGRVPPPNLKGRDPIPKNADKAILAAFDKYEVVGLGVFYGKKNLDNFILGLLRNQALPDKVNDIAVECGNSLYQPILDRYIAGENVPLSEVQKVWRNTTQPNCGLSIFYDEFFPLVRRINRTLPPNKKLRVLACDPPINWSKVKSAKDMKPFMNRDSSIASVMEREVLAKHRKALMIFGASHLVHGEGSAVAMYESAGYPNVTLTVLAHNGFGNHTPLAKYNDQLEDRMASWQVPSLVTVKNTWLGNLDSTYVLTQNEGGPLSTKEDAYLYLGPRSSLVNEPRPTRTLSDKGYLAELRRRADISTQRPRDKSRGRAKKQTER